MKANRATSIRAAGPKLVRLAAPLIIVLLFALALIQAHRTNTTVEELRKIAPQQRAAQVAACRRGNLLRTQVNRNVEVLGAFIHEATQARRASGDNTIADRYEHLLPRLEPLATVDCELAFPAVPGSR